jgi:hypothetical protein
MGAAPEQPGNTPDDLRRRLLRSAPWVLTLAARPVLGTQCIAPSQTLSGALSHAAQKVGSCSGQPATFYLDNPGSWGLAYPEPSTEFYSVFYRPAGATLFVHGGGTSFTFLEVLSAHTTGGDPGNIGLHIAAAWLNIAAGLIDPIALDAAELLLIWQEYITQGFYRPFSWNPTVQWFETDIVAYLVNNAIAP